MRKTLLVALVVTMALLAGCSGGGSQSATDDSPANATASGDAPQNINTFYVDTDEGEFFCIEHQHKNGAGEYNTRGFYGLSCTPVGQLREDSV